VFGGKESRAGERENCKRISRVCPIEPWNIKALWRRRSVAMSLPMPQVGRFFMKIGKARDSPAMIPPNPSFHHNSTKAESLPKCLVSTDFSFSGSLHPNFFPAKRSLFSWLKIPPLLNSQPRSKLIINLPSKWHSSAPCPIL